MSLPKNFKHIFDIIYVIKQVFCISRSKEYACDKEYTPRPAKETCICNNENTPNDDFYYDVPKFNCYENLMGEDCYMYETTEDPEEESLYDLLAQP